MSIVNISNQTAWETTCELAVNAPIGSAAIAIYRQRKEELKNGHIAALSANAVGGQVWRR
jgi:hypothetical protein